MKIVFLLSMSIYFNLTCKEKKKIDPRLVYRKYCVRYTTVLIMLSRNNFIFLNIYKLYICLGLRDTSVGNLAALFNKSG